MSEMVDEYFASHIKAVRNKKLTIDMIEDFLLQARAGTERIMKEAAAESIRISATDLEEKKKPAHAAERG